MQVAALPLALVGGCNSEGRVRNDEPVYVSLSARRALYLVA